ncbi:MAG: signal peptidase II, partial [Romboutsia sp.]|nr:signal peptidase II [Romboutsia sp.]
MIYELIVLLLIGIDQVSKILALKYLKNIGSIPIIQDMFHLTYVENRGAAFGMFQNNQIIFVIIALIASIFGLYYLHKKKVHMIGRVGIILIIAGAIGNLIDRVRLGFVVDYFDFRIIWEYVFNIADIFVVLGTILLCIYILFYED